MQATASAGTINWYTTSSGGSAIRTSNSGESWTTPSISANTTYYAEATIGGCVSTSRTAVSTTVSDALLIIGKDNTYNLLRFNGTTGDANANNTVIGERLYSGTEAS